MAPKSFYHMAKTRSDRDKLCRFWSKLKSQESQNKFFLFIASYLVHLILEGFVEVLFIKKLQHLNQSKVADLGTLQTKA